MERKREEQLLLLADRMMEYDGGDARRIQHFIKVHDYARLIGIGEGLSDEELFVLEAAALVHDIGIKVSEEKYGDCSGEHQELEGPPIALAMLSEAGFEEAVCRRVAYLVGHHHTYTDIQGMDYQILVEADFLVNLQEEETPLENIQNTYDRIFVTGTGKRFCRTIFGF